jgi:DNA primase small subunit
LSFFFLRREEFGEKMKQGKTSAEKWKLVQAHFPKYLAKKGKISQNLLEEIKFQYTYPRLDIEVTKGLNHLLKSPFCIHPKTGRVCVPIDLAKLDSFDPEKVPTITQLCEQLEISDYIKSENKVKGN